MRAAFALMALLLAKTAFADEGVAVTKVGVGLAECSVLVDWKDRDIEAQSVVHWAEGYWTGLNLYLSSICEPKHDLSSLFGKPEATLELLYANCLAEPDWLIIHSAHRILRSQPRVAGTRSAGCTPEESAK